MGNVIPFPNPCFSRSGDVTLAVFAHALPELVETDGVFDAEWLAKCIVNTTKALFAVRRLGMPIAHLTLAAEGQERGKPSFNIPGLKARPTEAVFEFSFPSIFSNDLFGEYLNQCGISNIVLFGFVANDTSLVAAIEAGQRNSDITIVRDCSPLFSIDDCSLEISDAVIFGTLSKFASVLTLADFIQHMSGNLSPMTFLPSEALLDPETLQFMARTRPGMASP